MNNKIWIVILCLAFASLACLSTSSASLDVAPVATNWHTLTNTVTVAATLTSTATAAESSSDQCARVVAIEALHLREGASSDDIVVTWLRSGDVVQVLNNQYPDWWRVEFGGIEGFARSSFLEEVECVK